MMLISDIQRFCMHDGPGIRTTVFFKGCPLRCAWCHNPETQSGKKELLFYKSKCIGCGACNACENEECVICGRCAQSCPTNAKEVVGSEYSPYELYEQIQKDDAFYGKNGGVTFSGGECMMQIDSLVETMKLCKENGIHTAVDTAGYVPFESFKKIFPYTDLFLYDVKLFDPEKHKKYTGVGNELILNNLKKLFKIGARIWIRIPIVTSVNDSAEEMQKIKVFFDVYGTPEKVELLPYHPMGESKCQALGKNRHIFEIPTAEKMKGLKEIFGQI